MRDVITALATLDQYMIVVAACFVGVTYWLIRETVQSTALALISAPILMLGALAANYLFLTNGVIAVNDKDTNVVVASAAGVLIALLLLLLSLWISVLMSERRSANKQLKQLEDAPPAGE